MARTSRNAKKSSSFGPRIVLWYADDSKNYSSNGHIEFTKETLEKLNELFAEHAEHDDYKKEDVLKVPFFLRENDKYSDEWGSLAYDLVGKD